MLRGILIAVLSIGIAGTAYWGYQEHREKNAILLNAENNYQRAFHDLSFQVGLLHEKIGATLAMNSRKTESPALIEVWKISSEAHSDVGQLPLTILPFNKTDEFLSKVGDFSYRTAVRDLDKEPLTEKEYSTLKELYKQSGDIHHNLENVQHMVLKNNLRWMDVEMAMASGKEKTDNTIIDGFKKVENTVSGFNTMSLGPTLQNKKIEEENLKNVKGKNISGKEAANIAEQYMNFDRNTKVKVTRNGKGADYGFYSVSLLNTKTKDEANMDITKKGGYPIWFINSRTINQQRLSLNNASERAASFLDKAGFSNMELFESAQYDAIGVFDFITKQDNVRIYPESVKIKVALDNGDIVGFSSEEYLKMHHEVKIPAPILSPQQAKTKINPHFRIMEEREAIILNHLNKEVLCYEFLGTIDEDTYRIFINAGNGAEEEVQKLKNAETLL